jgi:hypothetical protein
MVECSATAPDYSYDETLTGTGIYLMREKRKLGVYQELFYVRISLNDANLRELTRNASYFACVYIEALLKRVVHTWPWKEVGPDPFPLGQLLHRYQNHLPHEPRENLFWLTKKIYNPAKHNIYFENDENEPENYF